MISRACGNPDTGKFVQNSRTSKDNKITKNIHLHNEILLQEC